MPITINGNGTITGYDPAPADGTITTAKLADGAVTPAKRGSMGILQIKQNSNTTAQITNITSTSWATSTDLPYVDITPIGANSLFELHAQLYGEFGASTIPALAFCVSTDGGSNWTYNIHMKGYPSPTSYSGTNGNNYGAWMSWGGSMGSGGTGNGDGIRHYETLYKSGFSAAQANIRFSICYRNVYHNSMANAFNISTSTNPGCQLRVKEIRE